MAFKKVKEVKTGGKFLAYGTTASGKTFFGLTFPRIAVNDSESGTTFYVKNGVEINGKVYKNIIFADSTSSLDDLEENLDSAIDGEFDGEIDTFIVDSETKFYNTMQIGALEVEEKRARRKGADVDDAGISVKQWGRIKLINMKLQQAKIDLSSKGIHVVSIAQAVEVKSDDGKRILGYKPDMHKSVPFDYDIILFFFTETDKKTGEIHYYARVEKDRTNVTKIGQVIENCTYDIWKDYFDAQNGLEVNKTSYAKDLVTSTESMLDDADKSEQIATELKSVMKELAVKNKAYIAKVSALFKENDVDIKKMEVSPSNKLQEILDFAKLGLD